jgi:Fe-S oxidoreductase
MFLIFLRNSGIRIGDQHGACAEAQIHSCSSCGICLDVCQLGTSAGITNIQAAYLVKGLKRNDDIFDLSHNCLMCGRCEQACPVGIELGPLRMIQRREGQTESDMKSIWSGYMRVRNNKGNMDSAVNAEVNPGFSYLGKQEVRNNTEVLYFAGCMTHLTPGISKSMIKIFEAAGVNYDFMDKDGSVCCGRPLTLAGKDREARELIRNNTDAIWRSGAKVLVTSCPICYKIFNESYHLGLEIMHHTQYINQLIESDMLELNFLNKSVVYHDPCELGRNSGIYSEPREVLLHVARLRKSAYEKEDALCCGGSLANLKIDRRKITDIAVDVYGELTASEPDFLATSCPLCKKTFSKAQVAGGAETLDIAEIVAMAIDDYPYADMEKSQMISATGVIA